MDTNQGSRGGPDEAIGPVAADRPVVDGTTATPEQLRTEVDQARDPDQERVAQLRSEVAGTAEELAARLDVPARLRAGREETVARLQVRKEQAVARLRPARDRVAEHPGLLAGVAALLLLVVVARRRRRRASRR